jgi:hypothetical protein
MSCNGTCLNLQADGNNCGRCGHSCAGGTCQSNVCQPVTLASGISGAYYLAVDTSYVYWSGTGVGKVSVYGGTPAVIAPAAMDAGMAITVDSTNVYWVSAFSTDNSTVSAAPLAGGTIFTVATGQAQTESLAMDLNYIYMGNYGAAKANTGSLTKAPLNGGTLTTLVSGVDSVSVVTVSETQVFFFEGSTLLDIPIGGGSATTLATGIAGGAVTSDGTYFYLTQGTEITRLPMTGGSMTTIATGQSGAAICADGTNVYWINSPGNHSVMWMPASGNGTPAVLASGQNGTDIVQKGDSVYWYNASTSGTAIMKIAKP